MQPGFHRRASLGLAWLVVAAAARATIVVDPAGGGDFTTLEAALDAALDGEQILVKSGTYLASSGGHLVIDGKGLSIVAEAGAAVTVSGLQVKHLPAGHWVIVRGLSLDDGLMSDASPIGAVHVTGPQGAVWLEDCTISGHKAFVPSWFFPTYEAPSPAVGVEAGGSVTLQRCTLRGGDGVDMGSFLSDKWTAGIGAPGLQVAGGRAAVLDSQVTGGRGGDGDALFQKPPFGANGGPGVHVKDGGFAHISGCVLTGGDTGLTDETDYDMPGSGLVVHHAQAWLRDSATQTGEILALGEPSQPIETSLDATLLHLDVPARSLHVTSPLREGEAGTLTVQGQPGDAVLLLVALDAGYAPLAGKKGVLALGGSVLLLPLALGVVTDPSGTLALDITAPDLNPALGGLTVPLQLVVVSGGVATLEAGSALAWLDASY